MDPKTACKCFGSLDFNALSGEALDQVTQMFYVPPHKQREARSYETERFSLFCKVFVGLEKSKREEKGMLHRLDDFSPVLQQAFIISSFKDFTDKERGTVVYGCSDLPLTIRNEIFASIWDDCNPELRRAIEYLKSKSK